MICASSEAAESPKVIILFNADIEAVLANHLNRVSLQKYGFLALGALFIALGTEFITVQQEGALAITLYGEFRMPARLCSE